MFQISGAMLYLSDVGRVIEVQNPNPVIGTMGKNKKTRRGKRGSASNKKSLPRAYASYADVLRPRGSDEKEANRVTNISGLSTEQFKKTERILSPSTNASLSDFLSASSGRCINRLMPRSAHMRGISLPRILSAESDIFRILQAEDSSPQSIIPRQKTTERDGLTISQMFVFNHWRDPRPSVYILFPQPSFTSELPEELAPSLKRWLSDRGWKAKPYKPSVSFRKSSDIESLQ